jgi:hypothetical protein
MLIFWCHYYVSNSSTSIPVMTGHVLEDHRLSR